MSSIRDNMREIKNNADLAEQKANSLYKTIRDKDLRIEELTAQNKISVDEMNSAIQRAAKSDKREQATAIWSSLLITCLLIAVACLAFNQL